MGIDCGEVARFSNERSSSELFCEEDLRSCDSR